MAVVQRLRFIAFVVVALWSVWIAYRYMNGHPIVWEPILITLGAGAFQLWRRTMSEEMPTSNEGNDCADD